MKISNFKAYLLFLLIIPFLLLIIFILTCCSSEKETNSLTNDCNISKKSIEIPFLSNSILQNFHHFSQICRIEDKEIYVGFSRKSHQLEWLDLETEKVAGTLSIPKMRCVNKYGHKTILNLCSWAKCEFFIGVIWYQ